MGVQALTVGSLFSGYGGLDLALESLGFEVKWQVEKDPECAKVLQARWPQVKLYEDVLEVSASDLETVDAICGGFPCQPVSQAGARQAQSDERWLWPEFARLVGKMGPSFVFVENVPGLWTTNAAGSEVISDLARLGYDARWGSYVASSVGACHLRRRVFVVAAHPGRTRRRENTGGTFEDEGQTAGRATVSDHVAGGAGPPRLLPTRHANVSTGPGTQGRDGGLNLQTLVAWLPTPTAQDSAGSPNATANRKPGHNANIGHAERWGEYAAAIARHEHALGRPAPEPVNGTRLAPRFVEWMMGLPEGWVTDIDGLSATTQLRMLGNGVVPAQASRAYVDLLT